MISEHVVEPSQPPALGHLLAAGPAAAADPGEYALVIESVYEGYLLHYSEPRVVVGADADLALLAGDYLYALGLERLAALGDLFAVRELSDLISLAAQVHGESNAPRARATALWLASTAAIATGGSDRYETAKAALRSDGASADAALADAARSLAVHAGIEDALDRAAKAIESRSG